MVKPLISDLVKPRARFQKSANLERDLSAGTLAGFVPTSRTIEAVGRVIDAIDAAHRPRAISITGPYGSGKSSLALFLSALLGPPSSKRNSADALLAEADAQLFERLRAVRSPFASTGLVLAFASAAREPIVRTLARALRQGLKRFKGPIELDMSAFQDERDSASVLSALKALNSLAPVLVVVDEFGKSIEEYVATGSADSDLLILQELAEWANGDLVHPFVLMTLQHLSFDDYAPTSGSGKWREWTKIQGRFLDVPYVENARQWQHLMASVYEYDARLDVTDWSRLATQLVDQAGLRSELHVEPSEIFPLHPVAAIALPELCIRYGQHERTLFSFLAGVDSGSVPSRLEDHEGDALPLVYLHDVFDYFVESASHFGTSSASASRWLEVGTRIRDVVGCTLSELRVLKAVGVLNLISAGGTVRASKRVLAAALADGTSDDASTPIEADLEVLETRGIIVYRDFADEYRLWHGSDFDIRGAIEVRKAAYENESIARLLERTMPPTPTIAARHSQLGGILRVFDRRFVDSTSPQDVAVGSDFDGVVLLAVTNTLKTLPKFNPTSDVPVVIGSSSASDAIASAAVELAACRDLLDSANDSPLDWVARREVGERAAIAAAELELAIERAYSVGASALRWTRPGDEPKRGRPEKVKPLSDVVSRICDERYCDAPIIRNEMISRRKLTSQGAQARRNLVEALVNDPAEEHLGIVGYGPERAMYEALLGRSGIHQEQPDGTYALGCPGDDNDPLNFRPAWFAIESLFAAADHRQVRLSELYQRLMAAPIGLKEGPVPVLALAALLANKESIAVFENDTFSPRIDVPLAERLIRNPEAFALRRYDGSGHRRSVLEAVFREFSTGWRHTDDRSVRTLLAAVTPLLDTARSLNGYAQRTMVVSSEAQHVRQAILTATEPGDLLFKSLPEALDMDPFQPDRTVTEEQGTAFAAALKKAVSELSEAFEKLLERIEAVVYTALQASGVNARTSVSARATALKQAAHDPDLKSLVFALTHDELERGEWLNYLGVVVLGRPVDTWSDEDAQRFATVLNQRVRALRRLESLAAAAGANKGAYEVVQLSFSSTSHGDYPRLMWLDPAISEAVNRVAAGALREIEEQFGPGAREHLLAALAKTVLVESDADAKDSRPADVQSGGPQ